MSKTLSNAAPIKLNLGCFNKKMHGFINVDIREDVSPDRVDDIFRLSTFENNSADYIYACHVLEHIERKQVLPALKRWYEVLKSGGIVRIAVPDCAAIFAHYFYWGDLKAIYSSLGGSQKHIADYHLAHFDFKTLEELLLEAGFQNVKLYDRWKTEHAYSDDYSAAYHPHKDFANGKLLSLNVEAHKP